MLEGGGAGVVVGGGEVVGDVNVVVSGGEVVCVVGVVAVVIGGVGVGVWVGASH